MSSTEAGASVPKAADLTERMAGVLERPQVIGLALATVAGSARFFFQSLGSIGVGGLLVFMCGVLTGWVARVLPLKYFIQAPYHSLFSWPDFIVTSLGAGLIALLLVRQPHTRSLPASVALAYELYVPLGVAGFGLTSGQAHLWPDGLVVFLVHLAWAVLLGAIISPYLSASCRRAAV